MFPISERLIVKKLEGNDTIERIIQILVNHPGAAFTKLFQNTQLVEMN
jgi:hypothetical protein